MNPKLRIAILGANGQIGRVLFHALCEHFPGAEILGCVRRERLHFEGVSGDTRQHSIVFDPLNDDWRTLGRLDVVINCIGAIDERIISFETAHILPVLALLDHRAALGHPRIVQISALGAGAQSPSRFLRTKAFAEQLVLAQADAFVVRPSIVCTPGTRLVSALRRLRKLFSFTGGRVLFPEHFLGTKVQPVLPGDLAEVVCRLVENGSEDRSIDVAGADRISLAELLGLAGLRPVAVPRRAAGLLWDVARLLPLKLLSNEQYQLLGNDNVAETRAMEKLLGRKAESSFPYFRKELSDTTQMKAKMQPGFYRMIL